MISFIEEHRMDYGVEPICKVLPIAPSAYYAGLASDRARRWKRRCKTLPR
jgi:putative transposase